MRTFVSTVTITDFCAKVATDVTATDLEAIEAEHARLSAIMRKRKGEPMTDEDRKVTLAHRLLTDLLDRGGGTPEDRAFVVRRLTEIHEGKF